MTNRSAVPTRSQAVPGTLAGRPFRRSHPLRGERGNGNGLGQGHGANETGTGQKGRPPTRANVSPECDDALRIAASPARSPMARCSSGVRPAEKHVEGPRENVFPAIWVSARNHVAGLSRWFAEFRSDVPPPSAFGLFSAGCAQLRTGDQPVASDRSAP